MRLLRHAYMFAVLINIPVFLAIWFLKPGYRGYLVSEDSYLENLSALLFLIAAILFVVVLVSLRSQRGQLVYLPLTLISLVGFFDEISFGERIFRFQPILIGGRHRIDGVHDFLAMFVTILQENSLVAALSAVGVGAILIWLIGQQRKRFSALLLFLYANPSYCYASIAAAFVSVAMVIDLGILGPTLSMPVLEELLEMNAGFTMCCASAAAMLQLPWYSQIRQLIAQAHRRILLNARSTEHP
jgi:hypothetical protein